MSIDIQPSEEVVTSTSETKGPLHVYGQFSRRGPAAIVGSRAALMALREAIDKALETGAASLSTCVADSENYTIGVECDDSPTTGQTWPLRAVPYSASYAEETRADAIWPDVLSP